MAKALFAGLLLGSLIGVVLAVAGIELMTAKGLIIVGAILVYSLVDRLSRSIKVNMNYEFSKE